METDSFAGIRIRSGFIKKACENFLSLRAKYEH
jgi:hypothetical protein